MKRGVIGGLLLAVLLGAVAAVVVLPAVLAEHVYTASEVRDGVRLQPASWLGYTVWVRGGFADSGSITYCVPAPGSSARPCHESEVLQIGSGEPAAVLPAPGTRLGGTLVTLGTPGLAVSVPRGPAGTDLPVSVASPPLPLVLYDLPWVGQMLGQLFPVDGRRIYHVRLNRSIGCAIQTSDCPIGTLVP